MIIGMTIFLVLSVALCAAMIPISRRLGLVDRPGGHKSHESETPLAGGPALFVVFLLICLFLGGDSRFLQGLAIGSTLLFITGLIDDLHELSSALRFLAQITACIVMIYLADVRLEDFGRLFWNDPLELGRASAVITIFAALGVINAFNLIDGMDGLAGMIFLVAAAGMALLAALAQKLQLFMLLYMCMGAVLGFMAWNARLPWNPRARLFLGDSGSLLLGFVLAWCFIALGNDQTDFGGRAMMPMTAVWLIAVPLLDTSTLIWTRWREGRSAFQADQYHLQHAFLRAGYTVGQTWLAITAFAIALGSVGLAFELAGVPDYASFWSFLAVALGYYHYMRYSWAREQFLGRHFIFNRMNA